MSLSSIQSVPCLEFYVASTGTTPLTDVIVTVLVALAPTPGLPVLRRAPSQCAHHFPCLQVPAGSVVVPLVRRWEQSSSQATRRMCVAARTSGLVWHVPTWSPRPCPASAVGWALLAGHTVAAPHSDQQPVQEDGFDFQFILSSFCFSNSHTNRRPNATGQLTP